MNSKQVIERKVLKPEGLSKGRCEATEEGMGAGHGLGLGGGLGFAGRLGDACTAVNLVKRERKALAIRDSNQLDGVRNWDRGCARLVGGHAALRHTKSLAQLFLGHRKQLSNCFDGLHTTVLSAPLIYVSISSADCFLSAAWMISAHV